MPKDQRLQAIKAAIMLLPDENREVLQTLLYFLSDVTAVVKENQMTPTNLAVCLAPSLFHLNTLKRENSSPRYGASELRARGDGAHARHLDSGSLPVLTGLSACFFVVLIPESSKTEFDLLLWKPTFLRCASPILPTQPWGCGLLDNAVLTRF